MFGHLQHLVKDSERLHNILILLTFNQNHQNHNLSLRLKQKVPLLPKPGYSMWDWYHFYYTCKTSCLRVPPVKNEQLLIDSVSINCKSAFFNYSFLKLMFLPIKRLQFLSDTNTIVSCTLMHCYIYLKSEDFLRIKELAVSSRSGSSWLVRHPTVTAPSSPRG